MQALQMLSLVVLPALVIAAGLKDLTSLTIPNWIPASLALAFVPAALLLGLTPMAMAVHLGVAAVALLVGAGLFALRVFGGGDAKLMAAVCLWLGLGGAGPFVLFTAVAGGALCLALIAGRAWAGPHLAAAPGWIARLMQPSGPIPYGVAIAVGALAAFPESPLMAGLLPA